MKINRRIVVVCIAVAVALLHFPIGPGYRGPWRLFVTGYLIDILLPFAMVLVLGVSRIDWLKPWWIRAGLVFLVGAASETLQYFGVPIFGRTFDPLDFAAFAFGTGLAAVFESSVLQRLPNSDIDPVE